MRGFNRFRERRNPRAYKTPTPPCRELPLPIFGRVAVDSGARPPRGSLNKTDWS
jgi:hypothetical protein